MTAHYSDPGTPYTDPDAQVYPDGTPVVEDPGDVTVDDPRDAAVTGEGDGVSVKDLALAFLVMQTLKDLVGGEGMKRRAAVAPKLHALNAEHGTPDVAVKLPDGTDVGTVKLKDQNPEIYVTDETAKLAHYRKHKPTEVEKVEQVRPASWKAWVDSLTIDGKDGDYKIIDPDGAVVDLPWLKVREPSGEPEVTYSFARGSKSKASGKEAIAAAWRRGELANLRALQAPPIPETPALPKPSPIRPAPARPAPAPRGGTHEEREKQEAAVDEPQPAQDATAAADAWPDTPTTTRWRHAAPDASPSDTHEEHEEQGSLPAGW